jgi:hypothetical protein
LNASWLGCVYEFVTYRRDVRWALSALALVALLAGCGPGSSDDDAAVGGHGAGHDEVPVSLLPAKPSKRMTVQQIAADLGCRAELETYKDYRQIRCNLERQSFILVDFDTDHGERVWLDYSDDYGGFYLVGENWIISGNSLAEISPLQDKFGGKITEGENHGQPPPSSPTTEPN